MHGTATNETRLRAHAAFAMMALTLAACGARTELTVESSDAAVAIDTTPAELCDGLDNDGDGTIDEGAPAQRCGEGLCERESPCGVMCVPGPPSDEICGGEDEDCDGRVDENLGLGALADAIEIREGVGGYDRCRTCRLTLYAVLAPTDEGYMAIWHHGISGGDEIPNVWSRRLGPDLVPLTEPEPIFPGVVLLGVEAIPHATYRGETLIRAVERSGGRDLRRFLRVDAGGTLTLEDDWLDTGREARNAPPHELFNGERMIGVGWAESDFDTMEENRLRITSANFDGSDLREFEVAAPYSRGGNISSYGGRVAVHSFVVNADVMPIERWTELLVIDASGEPEGEPRGLDVNYANWARWITRRDTIHFWDTTASAATERFIVDWSGNTLSGPTLFEDERRMRDAPSGDAILEEDDHYTLLWHDTEALEFGIEERDDDGELLRQGPVDPPPHPIAPEGAYLNHPELRRRGDEYHAIWTDGAVEDAANRIWVQRFGCIE